MIAPGLAVVDIWNQARRTSLSKARIGLGPYIDYVGKKIFDFKNSKGARMIALALPFVDIWNQARRTFLSKVRTG